MGELGQFMPFVLMFVVVYFFMIAPQMKRAKKEKKFAAELKRGDKVITKSGLHGKIGELNDKELQAEIEKRSTFVEDSYLGQARFSGGNALNYIESEIERVGR